MNEVRALVDAFDAAVASGSKCALALLVSVEGSSYRRPGARMLIREDGHTTGAISAGCLESDLIEHAKRVIADQLPVLIEYNTATTSDELAWGLGLGCNGVVRVLVEPLSPESIYVDALRGSCGPQDVEVPVAVATVYECLETGHGDQRKAIRPGSRVVIGGGEHQFERMEAETAAAIELILDDQSGVRHVPGPHAVSINGSMVRLFVEELQPPTPLIVFGAGRDAVPIVELARGLGWRTEVVDPQHRPASLSRFEIADKVTLSRPEEVAANVTVTSRTFAILMTHDYAHDLRLLGFLLDSRAAYIGVMGPKKRTQRLLNDLGYSEDVLLSDDGASRIYSPVGLDVGANSPFEIALAIVLEMIATSNGRQGGLLRERRGSIHGSLIDAEPVALAETRKGPTFTVQN